MNPSLPSVAPDTASLEHVPCLACEADEPEPFLTGEDDLTGKPGRFTFVRCRRCGLVYQTPRVDVEGIKTWYDDDYIAHRTRDVGGIMGRLQRRALDALDAQKERIVSRYLQLDPASAVLDVGCGPGTWLARLRQRYGASVVGVDFKDFAARPGMENVEFHCGLFYEQDVGLRRFDLVTMWHFLEHDYDPRRSLAHAREALGPDGRLVVEVPRLDSLTFTLYRHRWPGVQAPQHTALYDRRSLTRLVTDAGFEVIDHLAYGAFPAYFYLFAGAAFVVLRGRGLDPRRAIYPYFVGLAVGGPLMWLTERRWNWAMQTIICRRTS